MRRCVGEATTLREPLLAQMSTQIDEQSILSSAVIVTTPVLPDTPARHVGTPSAGRRTRISAGLHGLLATRWRCLR